MGNITQQQQTLTLGCRPLLDKLLRCRHLFRRKAQPDKTCLRKMLAKTEHGPGQISSRYET